jgi:hypothetical protein
MNANKLTIITGAYGSGKTNFALNLAFKEVEKFGTLTLADLDIVNPYYRSSDYFEELQEKGVHCIAPVYANTNVDLPSLPAGMYAVFEPNAGRVIIDVGGDDEGAKALGRFHLLLENRDYEMLYVINRSRHQGTCDERVTESLEIMREIEVASRCKVTGVINNTHMQNETTNELIVEGISFAEAFCKESGLPLIYTAVPEYMDLTNIPCAIHVKRYVKTIWE